MQETHERVYSVILQEIKIRLADGRLCAGCRLPPERECAEYFQVSRSAVREALRALELTGIVHCMQGEGTYLADNISECLIEPFDLMFLLIGQNPEYLQQIRFALEPETTRLAAIKRSDESIECLFRLCTLMEGCREEKIFIDMDQQFHMVIAEEAKNPFILSIFTAVFRLLESHTRRFNRWRHIQERNVVYRYHRRIAEAIASQREKDAGNFISIHIQMMDI